MEAPESAQLVRTTRDHLLQMMAWFPDAASCAVWGGPEFRYPFTMETFVADSRCQTLPTYSLVGDGGTLFGFGQYYARVGRCHLGRLVISPDYRSLGLGTRLIDGLIELGAPALRASECSLFVSRTNTAAARLYARLGFRVSDYPDGPLPLSASDYMVAWCEVVRARACRSGMPTKIMVESARNSAGLASQASSSSGVQTKPDSFSTFD